MTLLLLPLGMLPLACVGWLLVAALEGSSPVLRPLERWVYALIAGPTSTLYVLFLLHILGLVGINFIGFASAIGLSLLGLGAYVWHMRRQWTADAPALTDTPPLSRGLKILWSVLLLWMLIKIVAGAGFLMSDPAYNDDVFNNWHFRAKVIRHEEMLILDSPGDDRDGPGVNAYPPTVPLVKVWLNAPLSQWSDHLAASINVLWYITALALVYCTLRRRTTVSWALVGAYILGSLPLFLLHGSTAYADVFLSLHIGLAVIPLWSAWSAESPQARLSWLKLSALGAALLPFTKNEALLMHLPPVLLLAFLSIVLLSRKSLLHPREALRALLWYGLLVTAVLLPWVSYKWMHALPFGNAKGVGGMEIVWQEHVLRSLWVTYVYEANWLFLPGLLLTLLILRWKTAFRTSTTILTAFLLIVLLGIIGIFLFTGLSAEALRQTGSARAIIHLLPIAAILTTILLRDTWRRYIEIHV